MWDVHVAVPPDFLSPDVPGRDLDRGETNLMAYYRAYWDQRGEGYQPPAMGIEEPVQSFSHDNGRVLYPAPRHTEL